MEVMLEENPFNPWYGNPRRRRKSRRNPTGALGAFSPRNMLQGVGMEEVAGAVAGFAGASLIPPMIVREGATQGGKIMRLVAGLATAVLVGMAVRSVNRRAGQMAVVAGLAGVTVQAIQGFTPLKIAGALNPGRTGRLGMTEVVNYPETRNEEIVSIIQP